MEHRLVMRGIVGRPLDEDEIVHHIDHDRMNNDPGNLDLLKDNSAHQETHRSLSRLYPDLIRSGSLRYNLATHEYEAGTR